MVSPPNLQKYDTKTWKIRHPILYGSRNYGLDIIATPGRATLQIGVK